MQPRIPVLVLAIVSGVLGRHAIHPSHYTSHQTENETQFMCRPVGQCEPCPEDSLNEPYCQPYGNRRLIHCVTASAMPTESPNDEESVPENLPEETPGWEACGKVVARERADFWEFVATNAFFAAVALFILFMRGKKLAAIQYRKLAARIGFVRGEEWTNG